MSKSCIYLNITILLACTLVGCIAPHNEATRNSDMLVRVAGEVLTHAQLTAVAPQGLNKVDSAHFAEHYIQEWTNKSLLYQQAKRNVALSQEIEQQVANYRRELMVYEYQKQLLNEKIEQEMPDSMLYAYYKEHSQKFILSKNLVKGLFIKVPQDAPQLNELKRWYTSTKPSDLENIDKYSLRNTLAYEYFYDTWIELDVLLENIPYKVDSPARFLAQTPHLAHYDNGYWYLLNIDKYKLAGTQQPYEHARPQIKEILTNQRKIAFFGELYKDLYRQASEDGAIEYATESN